MMRPFLFLVTCFTLILTTATETTNTVIPRQQTISSSNVMPLNTITHEENLISWIRQQNGYFNPKLQLRRYDRNDTYSSFGMFANDFISQKERLLTIPRSVILTSDGQKEYENVFCGTAKNLIREMRLGNESNYAPYVTYLLDTQPHGMLPTSWSNSGQELLRNIIGDSLPPFHNFGWIETDWYGECEGTNDPLDEHAYLLVVQRGWDDFLIPVYDMMAHRNGHYLNTELSHSTVREEESNVHVRASRDIRAGEEIYTTYNFCEDCSGRIETYGTPEILRDYGFVEQYPQRWIFHGLNVAFEIDVFEDEVNNSDETLYYVTEWIDKPIKNFKILEEEALALEQRGYEVLESSFYDNSIPKSEYEVIIQYYESMLLALNVAMEQYLSEETCVENGTCTINLARYIDLEEFPEGINYDEGLTCDQEQVFEVFESDQYAAIEETRSHYQNIVYYHDSTTNDTCFSLDNVYQICTCYRPHYHESVVHYTARFLPNITRVLWVGGGDSMLLHEILKYKTLELAVGLELDQIVTRKAFQHFGVQPHYDNPKVQWWYGDASKTLLMLPREYFGSFDMVLVDLSETVMSNKVTDQLDIMETLSLLLKPEGIFVKNEDYYGKLTTFFDHTIQVRWYDNPIICSQALAMGSNTVNFSTRELTNHHVDNNLFIHPLDSIEDPFDFYHDYRRNESSLQLCNIVENDELSGDNEGEIVSKNLPQEQGPTYGILMIVEAEQVSSKDLLQSSDKLTNHLVQVLKKVGMIVISSDINIELKDSAYMMLAIILKEGYIIARTYSEHLYIAYDIHLWGSFEKHESVTNSLIEAIGSQSSSSFRIIAGGMFGINTWVNDEKNRGPHYSKECNIKRKKDKPIVIDELIDESLISVILEESMNLVHDKAPLVAVICGDETMKPCKSVELIEKTDAVAITLSCDVDIKNINEYMENDAKRMFTCEQKISNTLKKYSSENRTYSGLVIDSSASDTIAKVVYKVFTTEMRKHLCMPEMLVISFIREGENLKWRQNFVRRFFEDIFTHEPSFNADIIVRKPSSKLNVMLSHTGDYHFVQNLRSVLKNIETRGIDISYEIQDITGGLWVFQDNFQPSQFFKAEEFNSTSSLEQLSSQNPLGYQIIFQMESIDMDLSSVLIQNAFNTTIKTMSPSLIPNDENVKMQEFTTIGTGCLIVCFWSKGSIIVLWDGRFHVDINLFLFKESVQIANFFIKNFNNKIPSLSIRLRDEQPRGNGRVVNLQNDINNSNVKPYWSKID